MIVNGVTVVSGGDHAKGVLAALEGCGHPIGDGVAPKKLTLPYGVFYDLSGGSFDGPIGDPDADVEIPFQVTCVGQTPEQVRAFADKIRASLAEGVTVVGRSVQRVASDGLGSVQRDDGSIPPLFYLTPRWRLFTTPA